MYLRKILLAVGALTLPTLASAYVGPGAGISLLGALWGLLLGVFVAIGVILFWPIRAMMRKMKAKKAAETDPGATADIDGADTVVVEATEIDSAKTRTADHTAS